MENGIDLFKIRKILPSSLTTYWEEIMDLIIFGIGMKADKVCGPFETRVGVFGPYTPVGREIIDKVARTVSKEGFSALTGEGFYLPHDQNEFHQISELFPPLIVKVLKKFKIPDFVKYHHFPRLVSKAIHYLEPMRGQRNEVEGCYMWSTPMLGFVTDKRVSEEDKGNCNYLHDAGIYQECLCPDKELCFHPSLKQKCPFYDYKNIPWPLKQLFMTANSRLVAINDFSKIDLVIPEYLHVKTLKPTFSENETR
jgi:hypothetical protein